jgi:hypothetical protein
LEKVSYLAESVRVPFDDVLPVDPLVWFVVVLLWLFWVFPWFIALSPAVPVESADMAPEVSDIVPEVPVESAMVVLSFCVSCFLQLTAKRLNPSINSITFFI